MFHYQGFEFDLSRPRDISIPFHAGYGQVNAFYAPPFRITPVREGNFIGSTKLGGMVNFMNFQCSPHGNGTHTECVGHISKDEYYVNECIQDYFYLADLVSIYPVLKENGDKIIERMHIESMLGNEKKTEGLIIRTLPNDPNKLARQYSGTNPVYLEPDAMQLIVEYGVKHLLVDFPSVDKKEDDGRLISHKIFWDYPANPQSDKSITELVYVVDEIPDGLYLVHNQIPNIRMDAVPSRPMLYLPQ